MFELDLGSDDDTLIFRNTLKPLAADLMRAALLQSSRAKQITIWKMNSALAPLLVGAPSIKMLNTVLEFCVDKS